MIKIRLLNKKVYTLADADQPMLRHLVQAAWDNGKIHVAQMKQELSKMKGSK